MNQHFRNRVLDWPGVTAVQILGEGVFHQVHGGVATNVPMAAHPIKDFHAEYRRLTGIDYTPSPVTNLLLFGTLPEAARKFII